jgi:inosine-uridine nucleoside N-ribohydrolase
MPLDYEVPEYKRLRVIIDTDAACEADDPFAIAHALLSKKLEVQAIFAEHFAAPGSMEKSYEEINTVLGALGLSCPVYKGEPGRISGCPVGNPSPAAAFLIEEALRQSEKPLFVLCLGAITNVASALRSRPDIAKRMTVVWIGGHALDVVNPNHREFNAGNDVDAVNIVTSSGVAFWQIPNNVYGSMHIGLAEIQRRIAPCGKIGRHLFENMVIYNNSERAGWTAGESWSLGDSPAVGVALEPNCGHSVYREAPILNEDTSYRFEPGRPLIRVYQSINSRFILEDFISKLQLCYPE